MPDRKTYHVLSFRVDPALSLLFSKSSPLLRGFFGASHFFFSARIDGEMVEKQNWRKGVERSDIVLGNTYFFDPLTAWVSCVDISQE